MIEYLLLGLIFTSIFTIKSLFFNYGFSSSYNFIYQLEIIGLLTYNSKYVGVKQCLDCFNIFVEWLLLGWVGLPLENETVNSIVQNNSLNDIMRVIILISWLISLLITLIVKIINYKCKNKVYLTNIIKVVIKFFLSNYTSLLLWSLVSFIKETTFHQIKFWFELFNLFLFLFLIFGLKSIILYILYGQNRLYYKSIYMFLHNRFKPKFKLWFFVNLLFKDLLIIPTCLIVMNSNNNNNYLIVNYLLIFYLALYSVISFVVKPFKSNARKDNNIINIVNLLTFVYIIFNEFSLYLDENVQYILWILKMVVIFITVVLIIITFIKNYKIEKEIKLIKKSDSRLLLDNIELPTIKEIDV